MIANSFFVRLLRWTAPLAIVLLAVAGPSAAQHVGRVDPSNVPEIGAIERGAIIDSTCELLREVYVFPDAAEEMEKLLRKNLAERKYADLTSPIEFSDRLTEDLRSVANDLHLGVRYFPPRPADEGEKVSDEVRREQRLARLRANNFGFQKVERLPGNIGYLELQQFADAEHAGETAIATMNFLAWTDALIIDLRQNGGGSPSMIQLISSYLFENPVHLNSFYIRRTDEMKQFWSHSHVEGPRMTTQPVFVLTSGSTFSAAEEFTYNLKNLERATIIGETTGGGAHPVQHHLFTDLYVGVSVPFGRAVNPITGTNWEGTGVEPDIAVPAGEALDVAQIEAVKTILGGDPDPEARARLEWTLAGLEGARKAIKLTQAQLETFAGTYGPRKVFLDGVDLFYQREGRPRFRMFPMGENLFGLDGLGFFRIRFEAIDGRAKRFVGLYDDGRQDMNDRTGS